MKKIYLLAAVLIFSLLPFNFGIEPRFDSAKAYYDTSVEWNITGTTVWSKDMGAIVINWRSVVVQPGAKLIIEPGTIIKAGSNMGIWVFGELEIRGSASERVVLTSYCDNEYGDIGYICAPSRDKNIFGGIRTMDGGRTNIVNALIRYSGAMAPINALSKSMLNYAQAQYAYEIYGAISAQNGDVSVANSIIEKNKLGAGSAGASSVLSIVGSIIAGNEFGARGESAIPIKAGGNWWGSASGPWHETINPQGQGDSIAGNIEFRPWKTEMNSRDPVILIPGLMGSWNVTGRWELDPIFHTYDDLWQALKASGYEEGKTLFAFPYQWRLSNAYNATLLKEKINEIKALCDCEKVDLVAHSMGGLVARAYIQGPDYVNDIDQLIFLATPQRGAPQAYLLWEGGEIGLDLKDEVMEKIFELEATYNGFDSLYSYIRGLPMQSISELLPIYDYLRDNYTGELRSYSENYPPNIFLEQLNQPLQLQKLNGVRIYNFIGYTGDAGTANSFRVVNKIFQDNQWEHGYPVNYTIPFTDHGIEYGAGDGTVPSLSNFDFNGIQNTIIESNHSAIVSDSQKIIIRELTGLEPEDEIKSGIIEKFLLVRIFSPADFLITAFDGKKIGMTGEGERINEIPGAFYFNDGYEFALIPDPGDGKYSINLIGTGSGNYILSASIIIEGNTDNSEFNGYIEGGANLDFSMEISSDMSKEIISLTAEDNTPPNISIYQPADKSEFSHAEVIELKYSVSDDFSGVNNAVVYLDGDLLAADYIDPLLMECGEHILAVQAWDMSGNYSIAYSSFWLTTDIIGLANDINKFYLKGEIKKEKIKDILAERLDLINRLLGRLEQSRDDFLSDSERTAIKKQLANFRYLLTAFYLQGDVSQKAYEIIVGMIENILKSL